MEKLTKKLARTITGAALITSLIGLSSCEYLGKELEKEGEEISRKFDNGELCIMPSGRFTALVRGLPEYAQRCLEKSLQNYNH